MKKLFTLLAGIAFSLFAFGQSYGIMINGSDYHVGTLNPSPGDASFTEYMVLGVSVASGSTLQLYDNDNKAGWAVDLDGASVAGIIRDGDHYNCTATGCYDFYIKLKYNADQLYIGAGNCGDTPGGDTPGGGDTSGGVGNARYYYKGFIDDADFEPNNSSLFNQGVADINFTTNAMLFVIYQVDGQEGVQYMTSEWVDGPTHATLSVNGNGGYNKWNCPKGTTKIYLYDNGDGTLEISSQPMTGKTLVSGGAAGAALDNVCVNGSARKVIRNGQLFIIKNGNTYNALGAVVE